MEYFGGGAVGWKVEAVVFAVLGLVVSTFSVFAVKELPEEVFLTCSSLGGTFNALLQRHQNIHTEKQEKELMAVCTPAHLSV